MGYGLFGPRPGFAPGGGGGTGGCTDFIINSQAELETQFPNVANVHTLDEDGVYCFGGFALDADRRITIPNGQRVVIKGHGTSSELTGDVATATITFEANATVHMHDIKLRNVNAAPTCRAIESATTEAYLHDMALLSDGDGILLTGGRLFCSQLRASNCEAGIRTQGGELFLVNYDVESVAAGIAVDASTGGVQWVGGRANAMTDVVLVDADLQSLVLCCVTALSFNDFLRWASGTTNRATVGHNTCANGGNAIDWPAANIPTLGLSVVGNTFNLGAPFNGFTHASPRVNSKANIFAGGLMSETPIVP